MCYFAPLPPNHNSISWITHRFSHCWLVPQARDQFVYHFFVVFFFFFTSSSFSSVQQILLITGFWTALEQSGNSLHLYAVEVTLKIIIIYNYKYLFLKRIEWNTNISWIRYINTPIIKILSDKLRGLVNLSTFSVNFNKCFSFVS